MIKIWIGYSGHSETSTAESVYNPTNNVSLDMLFYGPMDIKRSPYKSFNSPRIKEPLTGSNFCDGQVRVVVRPIYSACVSIERDHRLRFPNIFFGHCPTPTCFCLVKYLLLLLPFPPLSSSLILSAVSTSTNTTFARSVFVLPPKIPSFRDATDSCCIIRCDHSRKAIVCFCEHLE